MPIYSEFATGPFLYRVGELLSSEDHGRYKGTSPSAVAELLVQDPPAASLVHGDESEYAEPEYAESEYEELESPLRQFAEEYGYQLVERDFDGIELYVAADPPN
jgi:hypothetical protein